MTAAAALLIAATNLPGGLPGLTITNGETAIALPTAEGPRVLAFGPANGPSLIDGNVSNSVYSDLGVYRILGGSRMWAAPEEWPATYAPETGPYTVTRLPDGARVEAGPTTLGWARAITVSLPVHGRAARIVYRLENRARTARTAAPWALTVPRGPGVALMPAEPVLATGGPLTPLRSLSLWSYTDLADRKYAFGPKLLRVRVEPSCTSYQKIGGSVTPGWLGWVSGRSVFVKRSRYDPAAPYPDRGANAEIYASGNYGELEMLGPLVRLAPGASATLVEAWAWDELNSDPPTDDEGLLRALAPALAAAEALLP